VQPVRRTAVVTDEVGRLGPAAANRLTADGVNVITIDIAAHANHILDVTDSAAVNAVATKIGTIDILINSAGIVGPKSRSGRFRIWTGTDVRGQRQRHLRQLASPGILANAIAPRAVIDTPMDDSTELAVLAHIASLIPIGHVGRPDEVGELAAWLSPDRCSFSTGAVYDISGGRAAY
jgi:NAD(P)-dependent dehydrogenase (short-subunit alcohol dehydrogenase family)